jgi:hypothetical protein
MRENLNTAFAYQLKYKKTKYSFIIVEDKDKLPISVIAYKGAIIARSGFVFIEDTLPYFIGITERARAKCIGNKMSSTEAALADMTSLALFSKVDKYQIIESLRSNTGDIQAFSNILSKGIRKYFNAK